LEHVKKMPVLEFIQAGETLVTEAGVEMLEAARPELRIAR
jgi:hypothetical protein